MRFHCSGQLRGKINVLLLRRVVDIDQHPPLGIRQVQSIIDMCPTALLCAGGPFSFLIGRLAAYLQSVLVPRTELNYICVNRDGISTTGICDGSRLFVYF